MGVLPSGTHSGYWGSSPSELPTPFDEVSYPKPLGGQSPRRTFLTLGIYLTDPRPYKLNPGGPYSGGGALYLFGKRSSNRRID